jgi:MFS family permease
MPPAGESGFARFIAKFTVLRGAIRELWLVFAIKFLAVAAYAVTNYTLVLWLSSDLGYSDQKALGMVAGWSALMTIVTLLAGPLTDVLGLRRTFFVGAGICLVARAIMTFCGHPLLALVGGLLPLAVGEALSTPVLVAAVRRYSTTPQRSVSFSIFYTMMNVGFLVASYVFDFVRQGLGEHGHFTVPLFGLRLTTYRTLFLAGLAFECLLLPLIWCLRRGVDADPAGAVVATAPSGLPLASLWNSVYQTVTGGIRDTGRLLGGLVKQDGFYRLLGFLVLIAFLKLIFIQMYYVYPKFGIRELGDQAPVGRLWAINSILIIALVPIVGALTQRFRAYTMVIVGGTISAASVFIMALPTAWFQGLANGRFGHWVGHVYLGLNGSVHPYYVMIALFVVLLSVGEAFYSPRVYEYAAAIAPRGQEASYGALSYVPFLLAKLLVGTISGFLLARYCPETGPRHSEVLWLFVALTASIAPLGLLLFGRFIRAPEAGRDGMP